MIVMPANSSGWFWHCLARETGKLGHLMSPRAQRGPWPWLPYALDNGAFSCWNPEDNSWNQRKWEQTETEWKHLLFWAQSNRQKAMWGIVPDRPGDWKETCSRWSKYAGFVVDSGIPLAVAVQDGATIESVMSLLPTPAVIAVGGSTDWKWETVDMWAKAFPRVHLLRCNAPEKLSYLEQLGVESCDGTGWNRGNPSQTRGLENFCRGMNRTPHPLWPHVCRSEKKAARQLPGQPKQETFA